MKRTLDFPIQISDWARYAAKDGLEGAWWEYESWPKKNMSTRCWHRHEGRFRFLFNDPDKSNWKGSLFEVMK